MKSENRKPMTAFRPARTPWHLVLLISIVANITFFALALLSTAISHDTLTERILRGFESGSLPVETDLRFETWMLGNECLILQMILNEDDDRLRQALGPKVYYRDDDSRQCYLVRDLIRHGHAEEARDSFRYTRYWHGHNTTAAAFLSTIDFASLRFVLPLMAYGSIAALALTGLLAVHRLRIFGVSLAISSAAFWALQYFAHSLGHGPADTVFVLGFVLLFLRFGNGRTVNGYVASCAAFGAVITYMEFFTGQLPTAAALLLPFGYFIGSQGEPAPAPQQKWEQALSGLVAFTVAAALTVAIKQLLAYLYFGTDALTAFTDNLYTYTQNLDQMGFQNQDNRLKSIIYAVGGMIWKWGKVLTYNSDVAAAALFFTTALAWLGAAFGAWRSKSVALRSEFLVCLLGAGVIIAWIAVFPYHTLGHGWFMIRMMLAPIALGWTVLIIAWQHQRSAARDPAN
jgi:hypothetical protein